MISNGGTVPATGTHKVTSLVRGFWAPRQTVPEPGKNLTALSILVARFSSVLLRHPQERPPPFVSSTSWAERGTFTGNHSEAAVLGSPAHAILRMC